jgi:uncharacterized protein
MKPALSALASGAVFGAGLGLSGMTRPAKVIAFLDVFGSWDPSLMFVMIGAIAVHFGLMRFIRRRERPLLDVRFHPPAASGIDRKLVAGAALFGVGWGLGGFCPGPAIVALGSGAAPAFVFVGAMALGMVLRHVRQLTDDGARSTAPPRETTSA